MLHLLARDAAFLHFSLPSYTRTRVNKLKPTWEHDSDKVYDLDRSAKLPVFYSRIRTMITPQLDRRTGEKQLFRTLASRPSTLPSAQILKQMPTSGRSSSSRASDFEEHLVDHSPINIRLLLGDSLALLHFLLSPEPLRASLTAPG